MPLSAGMAVINPPGVCTPPTVHEPGQASITAGRGTETRPRDTPFTQAGRLQEQGGGGAGVVGRGGTRRSGRPRSSRSGAPRRTARGTGSAAGRAVVVEHLADDGDRREAGEPGEVDRGLGVAAALEHAAGAGPQREHVTGPHEVAGRGRGSSTCRIVWARSAAPMPAARADVVDRHGERGVAAGVVGRAPSGGGRAGRGTPASIGMHTRPRAHRSMKLIASGVTHSRPCVRSPSFSRSSSSTTRTISPRRIRSQGFVDRCEAHVRLLVARAHGWSSLGRVTTMRQPCGSRRSGWISPPWRSTIHRAIARPRPAPPSARRAPSRRGRSVRRRGLTSASGMPGPSSSTSMHARRVGAPAAHRRPRRAARCRTVLEQVGDDLVDALGVAVGREVAGFDVDGRR